MCEGIAGSGKIVVRACGRARGARVDDVERTSNKPTAALMHSVVILFVDGAGVVSRSQGYLLLGSSVDCMG